MGIPKVFVSATSKDLCSYRKATSDTLIKKQALPVSQDYAQPDYRSVEAILRDRIAECDAVICLIGPTYGREPKNQPEGVPRRSYTQLEYQLAVEARKPVFVFVATDECTLDTPLGEIDEPRELRLRQIEHLRQIASTDQLRLPFRSIEDLNSQVALIEFDKQSLKRGITRALTVLLLVEIANAAPQRTQLGEETWLHNVLSPLRELLHTELGRCQGKLQQETETTWLCHFDSVEIAVKCTLTILRIWRDQDWKSEPPAVRFSLHVGEVLSLGAGHARQTVQVGRAIDVCRALASLGRPGQVLLTRTAFDCARRDIKQTSADDDLSGLAWLSHGRYLAESIDESFEVCEVGIVGASPLTPPIESALARNADSLEEAEMRGWRPSVGLPIPTRESWIVEQSLGEGGFGEVWLARHQNTKQHRVFKFCFDANRLRSFKREITLFRLLKEKLGERSDIARLLDVKLDSPPFFLESEFVESGNLAEWAQSLGGVETLSLRDRVRIVAQAARATAAAHSAGVIHKDLKPSNIFMRSGTDGLWHPIIADFGIGSLADSSWLEHHDITMTGFTESIMFPHSSRTGTRMYAPPESLVGDGGTPQGDVYALGVILYQMLVGDFDKPLATGWEHDLNDICLAELASPSVEADVVRKLLTADILASVAGSPQKRLPTVDDLHDRLTSLVDRAESKTAACRTKRRVERRRRRVRLSVIVSGILLLVCSLVTLAVKIWSTETGVQARTALNDRFGVSAMTLPGGGWALHGESQAISDDNWSELIRLATLVGDVKEVELHHCDNVTTIDNLAPLEKLNTLVVSSCASIRVIDLRKTVDTTDVAVFECHELERLVVPTSPSNLRALDVFDCTNLTEIEGLETLTNLETLRIRYCTQLEKISSLNRASKLRHLDLRRCSAISAHRDLTFISKLQKLEYVDLSYADSLTRVDGLKPTNLKMLVVAYCDRLESLRGIDRLSSLETLDLEGCASLKSIQELRSCGQLSLLRVSHGAFEADVEILQRHRPPPALQIEYVPPKVSASNPIPDPGPTVPAPSRTVPNEILDAAKKLKEAQPNR